MVEVIKVSVNGGGQVVRGVFDSAVVDVRELAFIVIPVVGCVCMPLHDVPSLSGGPVDTLAVSILMEYNTNI